MTRTSLLPLLGGLLLLPIACSREVRDGATGSAAGEVAPTPAGGQASVVDDESQKDVVKVAAASKDHTTLVAAVQAADLANALSNAGPFTVFAPTNAAFDKLPKGTVDELLKPENVEKLRGILQHHVTVPVFLEGDLTDGLVLAMADGGKATIRVKDGATYLNDARILGSVRASNGIVYVIDAVVTP